MLAGACYIYNRAFGALTGGCAPCDRAFGTLIVRSLFITKKFDKRKSGRLQNSSLHPTNTNPTAQLPQQTGHFKFIVRIVVYIFNCVWAAVWQECR